MVREDQRHALGAPDEDQLVQLVEHLGHAGGVVLIIVMHLAYRIEEQNLRLMPRNNVAK